MVSENNETRAADRMVIFDCDGVLVDSETLSARVVVEMAERLGVSFDASAALAFIQGRKVADWVAELGTTAGREIPDDFVPEFRARCAAAFDRDLTGIEGVEAVLAGLDEHYCCASSAPPDKIRHTLGRTGLLRFFPADRVHSAYQVGIWKPDPGLFLHAAETHGVPPERCAVVEDSAPGVLAGLRAGMTVFGYAPDGTPAADAGDRVTWFGAMRELPELLRRWAADLPSPAAAVSIRNGGTP
ncbi:HAD family hydrolase [Amycolatopsis sp. CA-230715]|uniref:HAD family hydrolase n=1 Tax=Amycolatopsis sp. CA-230715 TaxID=2745196 RepID=UPI001C01E526|nr:HAD-IA family hydrolase [Amycolatopsis sp. CA-230715]QWF85329.1 6-phosphogluconate phosphatase [Amycolatopsis sp. CA-230715]